jgi:hypothetical protein
MSYSARLWSFVCVLRLSAAGIRAQHAVAETFETNVPLSP